MAGTWEGALGGTGVYCKKFVNWKDFAQCSLDARLSVLLLDPIPALCSFKSVSVLGPLSQHTGDPMEFQALDPILAQPWLLWPCGE